MKKMAPEVEHSADASPPANGEGETLWTAARMFAANLFIIFHLAAFFAWCLPIQSLIVSNFKNRIKPYMFATGLFQGWDMFAPDPLRLNIRVDAEITYRDGSVRAWQYPRMDKLGFVDRYFKERYRKYATEYLRVDEYAALRPDSARLLARVNNDQPSNPPVTVTLFRSWSEIQPAHPDGSYEEGPWTRVSFFTYTVTPGDLQ